MTPEMAAALHPRETAFFGRRALPGPFGTWAGHGAGYPDRVTISAVYEEIAAAQPDATALVRGSQRMSYGELNAQANALAWRLKESGVASEALVGVLMQRSIGAVVAILAVLKAGAAYLPLDLGVPPARIAALLAETKPRALLVGSDFRGFEDVAGLSMNGAVTGAMNGAVDGAGTDLAMIDVESALGGGEFASADVSRKGGGNPQPTGGPRSLAYVMYTSGSSGQPKGVMIEQRSVLRLVRNTNYCDFGPRHVFLHAAPLAFDASTFEIWGALLNGSALVLPESSRFSLDDLARTIRDKRITTAWLTSGLFSLVVDHELSNLLSVKQLLTGGDVISARHVRKALEALPDCRVINGYGPTENTTFTCCHAMTNGESVPDCVPLGRPISNTFVYILNVAGEPVGVGEPGELFITGAGLARGYWNDPELTAERFPANPFCIGTGIDDERLYQTGDLTRWRSDGTIEFLGRIDDQTKIRGHRVEPLEIMRALESHPQVSQAYVLADCSENGKQLVACYTAVQELTPKQLRTHLQSRVPDFMIPTVFVPLRDFPLNTNGKVDRDALLTITRNSASAKQAIRLSPAGNEIRRIVQEVWASVLRNDRFGIDDNFFDVGGDSLLLMTVHARLQTRFSLSLPLIDLFEFTSIRALAKRLRELRAGHPSGQLAAPSEPKTALRNGAPVGEGTAIRSEEP